MFLQNYWSYVVEGGIIGMGKVPHFISRLKNRGLTSIEVSAVQSLQKSRDLCSLDFNSDFAPRHPD